MARTVQIKTEFSKHDGFLAVYATFRAGKVHTTYELKPGLAADVDREGRVLGVEVIKTFSTKAKRVELRGSINLDEIQSAVEKRFKVRLNREFQEIREAGNAVFATAPSR